VLRYVVQSIAALALVGGSAAAPSSPPAPAALQSAVDAFAAAHQTFPGVALAVRSPRLSWTGTAGHDAFASSKPLDGRAGFRVASVTKTFTAASILRLVEDGRLGFDDPISKRLSPATVSLLRNDGYDADAIHVRHLLMHSAGLYDYASDQAYVTYVLTHGRHRWTRLEQVRFAMTHGKPFAPPGREFHYSDTGYVLLGEILERRTGLGLAGTYRSLLGFGKLGLRATYLETLEPRPRGARPRAHQYYERIDSTAFDPSFDLYGGGGIVSTVDDVAHFYRALLGGRVFKKASTLRTMLGKPNPQRVADSGMGIFSVELGGRAGESCWGHSGFWGTTAVDCPRSGVTLALTVNQGKGFDLPSQQFLAKILRLLS
jgi:D-alanyl-D-alanine carboxypeptidase